MQQRMGSLLGPMFESYDANSLGVSFVSFSWSDVIHGDLECNVDLLASTTSECDRVSHHFIASYLEVVSLLQDRL